jgi:hypothetical protein
VDAYGKGGAPSSADAASADAGPNPGTPFLTRLASTHFVPGHEMLLRVQLESRCIVYPPSTRAASKPGAKPPPGPLSGPTCEAPSTCIRGVCRSDAVPPTDLELFAPLQTLVAEAGPQGGHHIWIAVRMKNMKQAGSTTKIEAVQPGTNVPIPPSSFAFTFDPDEGGYCKLYGLRYQLDNGGIDYTQFLGKPLDVTSTVVDANGVTASSTAHIQVAPTLLNP